MSLKFDCRFSYPSGFQLAMSFTADGPVAALWGPSGAGKTTILNLIAGVLRPNAGSICLGARPLFDSTSAACVPLHERRIGYVFQDYQLFPHLTVEANLRYGARRLGARRPERASRSIARLIEVLGLGPLLRRYPGTLSGGERQRVALGRAFASDPEYLLLDEPVSSLDAASKAAALHYLAEVLREFQTPALIVTHDESLLNELGATRIIVGGADR